MTGDGATIFALASGAGRSAIAVLRISGIGSLACLEHMCGNVPAPRRASLRILRDEKGEVLDRALVLWLPGPSSYTGEDSAELHVHGGPVVLRVVSDALMALGCRPAEPGEFSRRAFLHGRMDLLEAEGVADLVAAETEAQRRQALRQIDGAARKLLASWAGRLRRLLAWQEALIDFPDEDLPPETAGTLLRELADLATEIEGTAAESICGARIRDGLVVAVTGPPNAGKSSLVNALAEREAAIVAETPGTTRDVLEVRLDIEGVPVTLVDTAGLRDTHDPVEAEGIRRARARVRTADLAIYVSEASAATPTEAPEGALLLANKIDLAPAPPGWHGVSAKEGTGLMELRVLLGAVVTRLIGARMNPVLSRARHLSALEDASRALRRAACASLVELRGEELRLAMRALGRITGMIQVEEVLDTVFSGFCIGK